MNSSFADFGGNEALLCDICKLLAHMKHPEIYEELGVSPPQVGLPDFFSQNEKIIFLKKKYLKMIFTYFEITSIWQLRP